MSDLAERVAQSMADMLHADSMIPTDESKPKLLAAFKIDGIPNSTEAEILCYGGLLEDPTEEDDEPPSFAQVERKFPHVDEVIKGFF